VFCLGINLFLSYIISPESYSLPLVIYLIERASLRLIHVANSPERFSLNICSLAELLDMFYTRRASNTRNKIYALLGMSLNNPRKASL
jgi:hypothetical protein